MTRGILGILCLALILIAGRVIGARALAPSNKSAGSDQADLLTERWSAKWIAPPDAVSLDAADGGIKAEVSLPDGVEGEFVWRGERRALRAGSNRVSWSGGNRR